MASDPLSPQGDKIRCDACPVMCYIKPGSLGACDRYGNRDGELYRVDPHVVLERRLEGGGTVVPFGLGTLDWGGDILREPQTFVTAIGAGTTYPDYKPAPFIVSSEIEGVDMVTVVTEGIFSYCGVKVKIDTDRHLGHEGAPVRVEGEPVGHVTTGEYGSQMLSLGGVSHLTGGGKKEGRVTCAALLDLCNGRPVELVVDQGATVLVQSGRPPLVNGVLEERMRVGCGSATIGMFAKQWDGLVDEVVVVDDHITGVLSEHQAGKLLGIAETGIKLKGRRSTPGRYFQVAEPGTGWGGTNLKDPLAILGDFDAKVARPGLTILMVSTTGEHAGYFVLDAALRPAETTMPENLQRSVALIAENCEPALSTVLFMGGAGGSLRAGVTENPGPADTLGQGRPHGRDLRRCPDLCLARRRHQLHGRRLAGPREWFRLGADPGPGGSHRVHAAPLRLCEAGRPYGPGAVAFGVPRRHGGTPAGAAARRPSLAAAARRGPGARPMRQPQVRLLQNGRLHLQDGPIDLIVEAQGEAVSLRMAYEAAIQRFTGLLDELCAELATLRAAADPVRCTLAGRVARRMQAAVAPFAAETFITPMAAVAGARGRRDPRRDDVRGPAPSRRRQQRRRPRAAISARRRASGSASWTVPTGRASSAMWTSTPASPVRGIATSGRRGRSFSLGVADARDHPGPDRCRRRCGRDGRGQCRGSARTSGRGAAACLGHPARQRSRRKARHARRRTTVPGRDRHGTRRGREPCRGPHAPQPDPRRGASPARRHPRRGGGAASRSRLVRRGCDLPPAGRMAGLILSSCLRDETMLAKIRKIVTLVEEVRSEMGRAVDPPTRRAAAIAVIENPSAGRYIEDLSDLMAIGSELGGVLTARAVAALGIPGDKAESYGKAALVGEDGELEHAAAILHPSMGGPVRAAVGRGAALIPSAKKRGGPGATLDVPLGHKDAAFVRSHFDGMEVRIADAPRAGEILVAIAITDSGRPLPRVGGLAKQDIKGEDGLR